MARRPVTQGYYKAEDGETRYLPFTSKTVEEGGKRWTRIPKPKPKTQSDLRDEIVAALESTKGIYEEVLNLIEETVANTPEDQDAHVENAEVATMLHGSTNPMDNENDIEGLKDELQEWFDNLPQQLQDAIDLLESAQSDLGKFEEPPHYIEDIDEAQSAYQQAIETLDSVIDNLQSVEFPRMYE